jgi:hypothetical protein
MEKVAGERLLSTMLELRERINQLHQGAPQRAMLAKTYLDSLAWGIGGLAAMGQRIGFMILDPPEPLEYPKMLYRGVDYKIATNEAEEQLMLLEGFSFRVQRLVEPEVVARPPPPPIISVSIPRGMMSGDEYTRDTDPPDC